VPGTINIPLDSGFTTWAGWLIPYTRDFYLIAGETPGLDVDQAVRDLAMIGLDRLAGYWTEDAIDRWAESGSPLGTIPQIAVGDLRESLRHQAVTLIDVRSQTEWDNGRIEGARHIPLGYLADRLDEIPRSMPVVVQCAAGARSSIAASVLRAHGVAPVINLAGGIGEWRRAGSPTTDSDASERRAEDQPALRT
jgi:hydroxyacylglutathione hydrolase